MEIEVRDKEKLSRADADKIRLGIRPRDMNFEVFKMMRKSLKDLEKQYLKGQVIFVSQTVENKKFGNKGLSYKKKDNDK